MTTSKYHAALTKCGDGLNFNYWPI